MTSQAWLILNAARYVVDVVWTMGEVPAVEPKQLAVPQSACPDAIVGWRRMKNGIWTSAETAHAAVFRMGADASEVLDESP